MPPDWKRSGERRAATASLDEQTAERIERATRTSHDVPSGKASRQERLCEKMPAWTFPQPGNWHHRCHGPIAWRGCERVFQPPGLRSLENPLKVKSSV